MSGGASADGGGELAGPPSPNNTQLSASTAAANAANAGAAGSAGGAATAAQQNIPQWQKGLLGVMTGDPKYGSNAPALHALIAKSFTNGQPPQAQSAAPAMMASPMGQLPASPGMGQRPIMPAFGTPQSMPSAQGMQGQISPQLLQQLRQQYPQMFGSPQ